MNRGDQLGHYEIIGLLGAGGMGEVYRARDTTLDREVAIKVLPVEMAADAERLERFRREALSVAALNHPNIVTIHSVEQEGDTHFLTLEYVDGRTIDDLVGPGGLPIDKFFELAIPLADAISAAHDKGIAHRDLKPSNVMVSSEGRVKVLDFGLAKLLEAPTEADAPTLLATVQNLTEEGKVLGTVAYMSPEQAEGKHIDHRSDVFSLGILLYEMATGDRPFNGDTKLSVLSAIVRDEPPSITELNIKLPRHLGRIVKKALEKDPKRRYQNVLDVRNDLDELKGEIDSGETLVAVAPATDPGTAPPGGRSRVLTWLLVAAAVVGVASVGQFVWSTFGAGSGAAGSGAAGTAAPTVNLRALTAEANVDIGGTISPDGEWVAFSRLVEDQTHIFLQAVGSRRPQKITDDDDVGARAPAFSPDGTEIAFSIDGGGIYVMGRAGDRPRRIVDHGHNPAWSPDGTQIVFGLEFVGTRPYIRGAFRDHLGVVDRATESVTELATGPDAVQPHWSPNGERIAYWGVVDGERDIWTIDAAGVGEPVPVTQDVYSDYSPAWSPDGRWLYYVSDRSGSMAIWRVLIDQSSGEPQEEPQQITTGGGGTPGLLSFAADGNRLVYTFAQVRAAVRAAPFDADALAIGDDAVTLAEGARFLQQLRISQGGDWLAFINEGPFQDVFVVSTLGGEEVQITDDIAKDFFPAVSPDGERVAYYSNKSGSLEIWVANGDGSNPMRLTDGVRIANVPIWSPDGLQIAYTRRGSGTFLIDPDTPWDQQQEQAIPNRRDEIGPFSVHDWHSDGRLLVTQGGVVVATYDLVTGEYTTLTEGRWPRWMADDRILMWRSGVVFDPDSGDKQDVARPESALEIVLSPDNTKAYYIDATSEGHIWLMEIQEAGR